MRILFVITSLRLGGAERMIAEMAPLLAKSGHHVDVFLFDRTVTPLLRNLEKENIKILPAPKGALHMWNPFHIHTLRNLIKKGNYDIIHTHNSPPQILTAFASLKHNVSLVTTEHNTTNKRRKYSLLKWLDPFIYKVYDHIVCVSKMTRDKLIDEVGINPEQVSVIHNGIDLSKFSPDTPPALSKPLPSVNPGEKIILMTGAFRKQKDQPSLIRAMLLLPDNYHLWLAGGWKLKEAAEKLSHKLGLQHRVTFLGERDDIPALMRKADINVLATHYEGLPLAAIEAMASGKPFLASDVPGVTDIASGAAFLVPPRNPAALAAAIRGILESEHLSRQISINCLQRASQYDIRRVIDAHISLYESLCR